MRRGTTLPELLIVTALMGAGVSVSLTTIRSWTDLLAVREAREAVLVTIHQARSAARWAGGAVVTIDEEGWVRSGEVGGEELAFVELSSRRIEVEVGGARSRAELRFGPRGVASFAATTVTFRRGKGEARLVISAQGRVRR